jgi:hypothetical protein
MNYKFTGVLSIIESVSFLGVALVSSYAYYKICKFRSEIKLGNSKLMNNITPRLGTV